MSADLSVALAPGHKVGLVINGPVMPAAGCFGLGLEYSRLIDVEPLGAIVVGPVTAGPRPGAQPPRVLSIPGGVLLHTGLANPGVSAVVRRQARGWAALPVPVIVHVAGTSPGETASCCRRLSSLEAVAAVELGLPDTPAMEDVVSIVEAARDATRQPLIVRLPLGWAGDLCEGVVDAGGDALTVGAPPRGTGWHAQAGRFVTGRLYGPFVLPLAIRAVRQVLELVQVPVVGCGGISSAEDALVFLRAGAKAVQIDGAIWRDPSCLVRVARTVPPSAIVESG